MFFRTGDTVVLMYVRITKDWKLPSFSHLITISPPITGRQRPVIPLSFSSSWFHLCSCSTSLFSSTITWPDWTAPLVAQFWRRSFITSRWPRSLGLLFRSSISACSSTGRTRGWSIAIYSKSPSAVGVSKHCSSLYGGICDSWCSSYSCTRCGHNCSTHRKEIW